MGRAVVTRVIGRLFARRSFDSFARGALEIVIRALGFEHTAGFRVTGEAHFVRTVLKGNHGLAIDVGAYEGKWSELVLEEPGMSVIALEPLAAGNQSLLRLSDSFPTRLSLVQAAAGDVNGEAEIFRVPGMAGLASLYGSAEGFQSVREGVLEAVPVSVRTLDEVFAEERTDQGKVWFLKVDAEGHECAVLRGARGIIEGMRPAYISVEVNQHHIASRCGLSRIASLLPGYRCVQILPFENGWIARDPDGPLANIYRFANFVFVADEEWARFSSLSWSR